MKTPEQIAGDIVSTFGLDGSTDYETLFNDICLAIQTERNNARTYVEAEDEAIQQGALETAKKMGW